MNVALVTALQQGLANNENDNTSELVSTNKSLAKAMQQMEMRCKVLEEKKNRLKEYKKMVKSSLFLVCMHC